MNRFLVYDIAFDRMRHISGEIKIEWPDNETCGENANAGGRQE